MIVLDLVQGSPEWEAWRKGGIGASDAPTIMGLCPYAGRTPETLWQELTGKLVREQSNFAMRRGNRLEPLARKIYEQKCGHAMAPVCCEHDTLSWLRASLYGYDPFSSLVLEIKALNAESHQAALDGQIPAHYEPQLQHQLAVTGASRLHYVSITDNAKFSPATQYAQIEVLPDAEYIEDLLWEEWQFWGMVCLNQWREKSERRKGKVA